MVSGRREDLAREITNELPDAVGIEFDINTPGGRFFSDR